MTLREGNMKAREICAQNSTEIPTLMTRLTKDKAFRETPKMAITPIMSTSIMIVVILTTRPVSNEPSRSEESIKITNTATESSVAGAA